MWQVKLWPAVRVTTYPSNYIFCCGDEILWPRSKNILFSYFPIIPLTLFPWKLFTVSLLGTNVLSFLTHLLVIMALVKAQSYTHLPWPVTPPCGRGLVGTPILVQFVFIRHTLQNKLIDTPSHHTTHDSFCFCLCTISCIWLCLPTSWFSSNGISQRIYVMCWCFHQ